MICPICEQDTTEAMINYHLDNGCPTPKKRRLSSSPKSTVPSTPEPHRDAPTSTPSERPKLQDNRPLAEVMRPTSLDEYVGQPHLVGPNGVLKGLLMKDKVPSIILWGPSGVGKTSFARLISHISRSKFIELSAVTCGTADIKQVVENAKKAWALLKQRTILFLDEIHRFNRAQQDSLLPAVERGDLTLIGATTENPSFKIQGALLSRCQVFVLQQLDKQDLLTLINSALLKLGQTIPKELVDHIAAVANGDARMALNMLEITLNLPQDLAPAEVKKSLQTLANYDQKGDNHYDFISALHKSVRGSDADAALYYLARMIQGGEDPLYISRRMIRMASEDIGLADDSCLPFAIATHTAVQQVGLPECDVMLAHCAVKLARATKSVEVYKAWGALKAELSSDQVSANAPVPMHLRNAPTKLMEEQGYSKGYKYNPAFVGPVQQEYLPPQVSNRWLGQWQPTLCDVCAESNCEHLSQHLQDFD